MSSAPLPERIVTSARLRWLDARDRISGRSDRLVPPRRLDYVGHSDFVDTGNEFLGHFRDLAELQPSDRVLDIGCGIGRMARPLMGYLDTGSYDGFDVDRDAIGWCRRRYRRHHNARFQVADLFNARYNPNGAHRADEYRFPYEDAQFDLAFATSVFTHLLPDTADHYIAEASRTLKLGGRFFITCFLLNDVSRALIADGRAGLPFIDADEHVALVDEEIPEEAVAYSEEFLFDALLRHGLTLTHVHPGSWCGRDEHISFQDIVIAEREELPDLP